MQISRELSAPSQDAHSKVKDWKLGRLNHVAIAVPNLERAMQLYRDVLGADVSDVMVSLPCTHVGFPLILSSSVGYLLTEMR